MNIEVSGSELNVAPDTASDVHLLRKLAGEYAPHGPSFLAVPFPTGAYPLLARKSPMWDIYALFPRNEVFERLEIERVRAANPSFILTCDLPLDGRQELRSIHIR